MHIAMWSGPRNLSTAMMYAFAARPDFAVWDEPFYAAYLAVTQSDHPMRDEIILSHERNPHLVAATCKGTVPDGKSHFYMKQMAHHMVLDFPLDWAEACTNMHLIRHPARVIASYAAKRARISPEDLGYARHLEIFERFPGPVVDSDTIRQNPRATLARLCSAIGLEFDPAMLSWPAGPKPFDGVWASHWYGAVHQSTGLQSSDPGPLPEVDDSYRAVYDAVLPCYEVMRGRSLTA